MKKFTVKDFITYNNPCFSCGEKISFKIGYVPNKLGRSPSSMIPAYIRSTITPERTEIDLKVTYTDTLQLWIFHKSNKILSTDMRGLTDYLGGHKLFLNSWCDKCGTKIDSHFLEFNINKGFIIPVGLSQESLNIDDGKNLYHMVSSFIEETSTVFINRLDKAIPVSPIKFVLPLLPLYKFKDKNKLLQKLKTYVTFS